MKGRIQHPKYTEATLMAANPLLLDGEIVLESDTGRYKIGDGTTPWNTLPYAAGSETIPALAWKVQDGMLCVKPTCDPDNPILNRCSVGILHYKNARKRFTLKTAGVKRSRSVNAGFKLVQDDFAGIELKWTSVRIKPVPFDPTQLREKGWMTLIPVEDLLNRWVETIAAPLYCNGVSYVLHRGANVGDREGKQDIYGKIMMQVTFYGGVMLFTGTSQRRIEGPKSYFKAILRNYDQVRTIIHI